MSSPVPRTRAKTHSGEASNLVAKTLGRDDGNLLSDLLVQLEVHGEARIVLLDEHPSGLLDSLGPDTSLQTHHRVRDGPEHMSLSGAVRKQVCSLVTAKVRGADRRAHSMLGALCSEQPLAQTRPHIRHRPLTDHGVKTPENHLQARTHTAARH